MTFFSRCETPRIFRPSLVARRSPLRAGSGAFAALAGFAEDLGILFRYAAGLDYYGRDGMARPGGPGRV